MPSDLWNHTQETTVLFQPPPSDPREQAVRDYPQTAETIARAKASADQERANYERDAELHRLEGIDAIIQLVEECGAARVNAVIRLVEEYSAARVASWVHNAAALKGDATVPYTIFPVAQEGEE